MKKSKRYYKKLDKTPLINKRAMRHIIEHSNICKYAIRELKLAGYTPNGNEPANWMYQQVIEAVAVFASHGNSGGSAPFEINLVQKLCNWDIISPLRFTNDEWQQISADGTCQNIRKCNVFKEPNGDINYGSAFIKKPIERYSFATKEWTKNKNGTYYSGGLFEHENTILTGRYFRYCHLWNHDVVKGWTPKKKEIIECLEVEISPDNWIMAVDKNDINLLFLSVNYNIQWKECPCMKGVRLEDVTPELEELAFKQIKGEK